MPGYITVVFLAFASLPALAQTAEVAPQPTTGVIGIVLHADPIVKGVMLLLLAASVLSWALWIIKKREFRAAATDLKADIKRLATAVDLNVGPVSYFATAEMIELATVELKRAGTTPSRRSLEAVADRVGVQLPVIEARAIHKAQWGANILASIGAIAPFVGLGGTVWGIMRSFLGIAQSQSTSLAVVAPGIAEALIATAVGLATAIPAVLIYNGVTRGLAGYRRLLNEVAVLTACLVSREAERLEERRDDTTPPADRLLPLPATVAAR